MRLAPMTADRVLPRARLHALGAPSGSPGTGLVPQDCSLLQRLGCGAVTALGATACAVTAGAGCAPALVLVQKAGCCDCLNSPILRDLCHTLSI